MPVDSILANVKAAIRFMRRAPAFSVTVILTLGLGIGANSAVFSAIDAILLRALPYPQPDQLVVLHQLKRTTKNQVQPIAPVRLSDWNRYNSTFQSIAGAYTQDVSETSGSVPQRLAEADVTPRFLQTLGVSPELGRDFTPKEEHFGGPAAVLISHRFWQQRFHGRPDVLGKIVRIEGSSRPIVGVLPESVQFPDKNVDIWWVVPMDAPIAQNRAFTWFTGIGRLKQGVSVARARADLNTVQTRLGRQFPVTDKNVSPEIAPLKETIVAGASASLWILFGSVSLLLLIACTNIAALLLSRTTERAHEIGIRYSLGAARSAIVGQLLSEAFVFAIAGSMLGLAIAAAGIRVLHSFGKALPRTEGISLDWRIVLYALCCAVVATLLCGTVPALLASRRSIQSAMASRGRTQVGGHAGLQWTLVGVQVALAVMLLVGAGLLVRSLQQLGRVSPGFDPNHVLTFRVSGNYGETGDQQRMFHRMKNELDAVRAMPGVSAAAITATVPGAARGFPTEIKLTDAAVSPDKKIITDEKVVYGSYFETLRIPLLSGETCNDDTLWTTAIVNRSFAETYFPDQSAIGHHIQITAFDEKPAIIGVVADARESGLNNTPVPTIYWCSPNANPSPYFLVRTYGNASNIAAAVIRTTQRVEPSRSVFDIMPLEEHLSEATAQNRFRTLLLALFAVTAILLAAIGLYGTLSYLVAVRNREIGLRMALGALPGQIRLGFLRQGAGVSLLGCVIGLALAAAGSRWVAGMLYGVSRLDPFTYIAVAVGVLGVAIVASGLPASRSARVDPMKVLRED